jgi:hypothetical protein
MITQAIHRQQTLTSVGVPLTAYQAFQVAQPAAMQYDPQARLALVASDEDISSEGDSRHWSFYFDLSHQRAQAIIQVTSDPEAERLGQMRVLLIEQVRPFPEPGSQMAVWLQEGTVSQEFVTEQWHAHLANRPALPIPFRDSPEAVRALSEQGVDFITGDTSMVLSGEVLPTGEAVWRIVAYDVEYQTPFV